MRFPSRLPLFALYIGFTALAQGQGGPFRPTWAALEQYQCPPWFRDAKFGIWAHWGPQSVPELGDWYARFMYNPDDSTNEWRTRGGAKAYAYHLKTYGHPSEFGYKDLIPLFRAEKWDPAHLMQLYYRAGARYFMSMGQHHDNFDLWDSKYQPWNSVNMGPKRDIVGEWQAAARAQHMHFGISLHGESSWSWLEASRGADRTGPRQGVPYDGNLTKADGKGKWWEGYDPQDLYCRAHPAGAPPDQAYMDKFIQRVRDVMHRYQPDLIYFDGGLPFDRLDVAAEFYNLQADASGKTSAVIAIKRVPADRRRAVVLDIENGQADDLLPYPWQTDTSLDGWFVARDAVPTPTKAIVQQLVDIVSKNGNLMLNITQRADGTIKDYAVKFLDEMATWMAVNGEAIHGTRPWVIYGEGPTRITDGESNKSKRPKYTAADIRFTTKARTLYAILLAWPQGPVTIHSLGTQRELWFGAIKHVNLLGSPTPLRWRRQADGLTVELPQAKVGEFAYVLKITGD